MNSVDPSGSARQRVVENQACLGIPSREVGWHRDSSLMGIAPAFVLLINMHAGAFFIPAQQN